MSLLLRHVCEAHHRTRRIARVARPTARRRVLLLLRVNGEAVARAGVFGARRLAARRRARGRRARHDPVRGVRHGRRSCAVWAAGAALQRGRRRRDAERRLLLAVRADSEAGALVRAELPSARRLRDARGLRPVLQREVVVEAGGRDAWRRRTRGQILPRKRRERRLRCARRTEREAHVAAVAAVQRVAHRSRVLQHVSAASRLVRAQSTVWVGRSCCSSRIQLQLCLLLAILRLLWRQL